MDGLNKSKVEAVFLLYKDKHGFSQCMYEEEINQLKEQNDGEVDAYLLAEGIRTKLKVNWTRKINKSVDEFVVTDEMIYYTRKLIGKFDDDDRVCYELMDLFNCNYPQAEKIMMVNQVN